MQGIEILASAQVATEFAFNWDVFWITFGLITSVTWLITLFNIWNDICTFLVLTSLILSSIGGGLFGLFVGKLAEKPITYEPQYKVTISEEVSMTEFYEHYEVIGQDGKIFTVREKTNER